MTRLARLIVPGLLLVAVYYSVFGGEYSALELRARRADLDRERIRFAHLEAEIDSLAALSDSLRHDDYALERVAREHFGMIKQGETLYRFAEPEAEPEPSAEGRADTRWAPEGQQAR